VIERERRSERLARMENVLSRQPPRVVEDRRLQPSAVRRRLTAVAFLAGFALYLLALGLSVVSGASAAERIVSRAVPALTDQDGLVALHLSDLRAKAAASGGKPVPLPWFPVSLNLSPSLITGASAQSIELNIDRVAAQAIYQDGEAAFSSANGRRNVTGPLLSPTWTLRQALGLLNAKAHARFALAAWALGVVTAALALLLCLQLDAGNRLAGVGAAGSAGALLAGIAALLAWLLVQFNAAGTPSPLGDAAWGMLGDASWTIFAIAAVALLCGIALLLAGLAFGRLSESRRWSRPPAPHRTEEPALSAGRTALRQRPLDRLPRARRPFD
jgi:hypothetical protein